MRPRIRLTGIVTIAAALLAGCAGGWRHGAPPEPAGTPIASPTTAAARAPAPGGQAGGPAVSAEGVTFTYQGAANTVHLAGEFNAWSTSADPMTLAADGRWTITRKLEPGRHAYKFVVDGGTWKEDPGAAEFVDDGYGGKNSVVVVGAPGAAPAAAPATPAAAAPVTPAAPAGKGRAPMQTDEGVMFTFAGAATSVHLAGDFNAWSTTADPMVRQTDGTWTLVKKLPPGSHEYKFVVNGTTWKPDEANPESRNDPYGGKNSLVTVK